MGQFGEIAVKRVLTREGNSSYFINNQPVRRRDVQDVFLGTGLGPRAYAIIGQGTISRIIESRPEELRLFLEEAAGVSKYKERRRETENRLSATTENLTRVEDILRELNANLDKLEKQAEVAAKYNGLNAQVTLKQHQLWFLKRAEAEAEQDRVRVEGLKVVNELEERMADIRNNESGLETLRQAHYDASDHVNQAQSKLYEATAEVGKLEAEIRYVVEGRQRVQQRLQQLAEQLLLRSSRSEEAQGEIENIEGAGMDAEEQAEMLAAQLEEQSARLPDLEEALHKAQKADADQRNSVVQVQQQIQVLAAEQRSLDEQRRQFETRYERLRTDRNALETPDEARLNNLQAQLAEAQELAEMAAAVLEELQENVPQLDEDRRTRQQTVNAETAATPICRRGSMRSRPCRKRSRPTASSSPGWPSMGWMACRGCGAVLPSKAAGKTRWKPHCANVWAHWKGRLDMVRGFLGSGGQDAPPARLAFFSLPQTTGAAPNSRFSPLSDLLKISDAGLRAVLVDWLAGCYTAPTLEEALSKRAELQAGETIYVPTGHAVTAHSVTFYAQDSEQSGLLARAQEIEHLERGARPGPDCRGVAFGPGTRGKRLCRCLPASGGCAP